LIRKVVVIGLDGLDPNIAEPLLESGALPALGRMRTLGSYSRLATTCPAQTPVAWSTFATGANPGVHGIFDFLTRDPSRYQPENALFRYERRSAFLPPHAVNRRGGVPFWSTLIEAGVPATLLRHPCTFPPARSDGRALAGVGVPDVRGGFGRSTWLTTDEGASPAGDAESVVHLTPARDGGWDGFLPGPTAATGAEARFPIHVAAHEGGVTIRSAGVPRALHLSRGEWSDWLRVRFRIGALQSAAGVVRFHLTRTKPTVELHASPIGFDPDAPLFPISHPWGYAGELRRKLGIYHTLGLAEDHGGLDAGRLDEQAFLDQCRTVMVERRRMLTHELGRFEDGFLFCLFDTPDRVQHMFWRFRDPAHPANAVHRWDARYARAIEDHYRECDDVIGDVLGVLDEETLLLVLSDHGFTDFRREVHLNAWLRERGLLVLRAGAEPGKDDLLRAVDWGRTQAYALGLAGIYLNVKGREGQGTVEPHRADQLAETIAGALLQARDPADARAPILRVLRSRDVYRGARSDEAPDLLVCCAPGWRVSTATALGGVPAETFSDNRRRWSGDHVVDPDSVPGVLFSNRPLALSERPRLEDLAPTILHALGVGVAGEMEGRSLLA
jgi:predicted AlkP superfamily phosphohydrolase/phosphomutase